MIDNIPWYIALPLAVIFWAFVVKGWKVDLERMTAEQEAARLATTGDVDPHAVRVLSDMGMSR